MTKVSGGFGYLAVYFRPKSLIFPLASPGPSRSRQPAHRVLVAGERAAAVRPRQRTVRSPTVRVPSIRLPWACGRGTGRAFYHHQPACRRHPQNQSKPKPLSSRWPSQETRWAARVESSGLARPLARGCRAPVGPGWQRPARRFGGRRPTVFSPFGRAPPPPPSANPDARRDAPAPRVGSWRRCAERFSGS